MRKAILWLSIAMLLVMSGISQAGQFWIVEENKDYWWYWDDNPNYQIMIPSKDTADVTRTYAPLHVLGVRSLDITLKENGPVMRISTINQVQGGYAAVRETITKRWQPALTGFKIESDSVITTRQNVKANFLVASGKTSSGVSAMIRGVAYFKGNSVVLLELLCNEKDYVGELRTQWIEAVNTFNWR